MVGSFSANKTGHAWAIFEGLEIISALTARLPEDKHNRLRALAQSRGTTLNRLIDEMTTLLLAHYERHDAGTHYRLRAARAAGKRDRGVELLAKAATP